MKKIAIIPRPRLRVEKYKRTVRSAGFRIVEVSPDLVLCIGGDGTVLEAEARYPEKPILALNAGELGFLTQADVPALARVLHEVKKGRFSVEERAKLEVLVNGKKAGEGLNDVVVIGQAGRALRLVVDIDRAQVFQLICDGLIVSTPTGSTGYNLSAGGPVLEPGTKTLIVTPVSPHLSKVRPLVLADRRDVEIHFDEDGEPSLIIDGMEPQPLNHSDTVKVRKSKARARLVKIGLTNYFRKIRGIFI